MDAMSALLNLLTGIVLRLAIPLGITAATIYILRRLDARWQAEAEKQTSLPIVQSLECWKIKGCSPKQRQACEALKTKEPCWQVFRRSNGTLKEECLSCEVFRQAPTPVPA